MIFFFDAKGNLIRALPESIKQGSNRSSRLWFFMPTAPTNIVNAYFTLPNRELAEPVIMTSIGIIPIKPNVDFDTETFSAWFCDIPKRITQYAGTLDISFDVASPKDEDFTEESITTSSVQLSVLKGVFKPLNNEKTYSYEELMSYLATIQEYFDTQFSTINLVDYQKKIDENLNTNSKEVVGAVNEVNTLAISNNNKITLLINELQQQKIFAVAQDIKNTKQIRQTADGNINGITVVDNSYTTVQKIQGDTVEHDGVLKNAKISGVKSFGRNLFDFEKITGLESSTGANRNDYLTIEANRISVKYGVYSAFSWLTGNEIYLEQGTYTFSADVYLEPSQNFTKTNAYLRLKEATTNKTIGSGSVEITAENTTRITNQITIANSGIYNFGLCAYGNKDNYTNIPIWFSNIQFEKGAVETRYESYVESVMSLPETVELGKWDYIQNSLIVKQTIIEAFDSTKHNEEDSTYNGTTNFVLSLDGLQVAYKTETPTITGIAFDNKYLVWNNGTEIMQSNTFEYGAKLTITNDYMIYARFSLEIGGAE